MKSFLCSITFLALLTFPCSAFAGQGVATDQHRFAATFDDLPVATSVEKDEATRHKIT